MCGLGFSKANYFMTFITWSSIQDFSGQRNKLVQISNTYKKKHSFKLLRSETNGGAKHVKILLLLCILHCSKSMNSYPQQKKGKLSTHFLCASIAFRSFSCNSGHHNVLAYYIYLHCKYNISLAEVKMRNQSIYSKPTLWSTGPVLETRKCKESTS